MSRSRWFVACLLVLMAASAAFSEVPATGLQVRPGSVIFRQTLVGGAAPEPQVLTVSVPQGQQLTGLTAVAAVITPSGGTWLTKAVSGNTVMVAASAAGLAGGTYAGTVTLSAAGFPSVSVKVSLQVLDPRVLASPGDLRFSMTVGGAAPPSRQVNINNLSGQAFKWDAVATTASGGNWLKISPASGSGKSVLTVSVDPAAVTQGGKYTGTITVTADNGTKATVAVTLEAIAPNPPKFGLGPAPDRPGVLSFTAATNVSTPGPQVIYARNFGGGGALSYTLTGSVQTPAGGTWLSFTPASGTTPGKTTVTANPAGLAPGDYTAQIKGSAATSAGTQTDTLTVYLKVLGKPTARLDPSSVRFTVKDGQVSPPSVKVNFVTKASLPFTAVAKVTKPENGAWLSVSPASGTAAEGSFITVTATPGTLAPGAYTGSVEVKITGAATEVQTISVVLKVAGPNDYPHLEVSPAGTAFVAVLKGAAPAPKTIAVRAVASNSLPWTAAVTTTSGGNWLKISPASDTATNKPSTVTLSIDLAPITAAGTYTGQVTFTPVASSGAPPVQANVFLLVSASSSGTGAPGEVFAMNSGSAGAMLAGSRALLAFFTAPAEGFSETLDGPVGVSAMVIDLAGNPIENATVVISSSNGEADLLLEDFGGGVYRGLFRSSAAGSVTLMGSVQAIGLDGAPAEAGPFAATGDLEAAAGSPAVILPGGVVNAASFAPAPTPLAPGSLVSIFGVGLAGGSPSSAASQPLPLSLGGVSVTIGGVPAGLLAVVPAAVPGGLDQINLQVPFEVSGQTTAEVVVNNGGVLSAPETISLGAAPAFFTVSQNGAGPGLFQRYQGSSASLITAGNPAAAGEMVVLYGTGFGDLQALLPGGAAATTANPTRGTVTATIGGVSAEVLYAGAAPFFVGVYQVNLIVPSGARAGEQPVAVFIDGTPATGSATVFIK